jgi:putative hydroxymethylpyrimidine transport system substrate-binding protein
MKRLWIALLALLAVPALAGAGSKATNVHLELDWVPTSNHVALYYGAQKGYFAKAGLDVTMSSPSDPSAPIKYVGLGKVDLAISYEPDVLLAAAQGLPVTTVASIVPTPLLSLDALPDSGIRSAKDLKGKKVGTTGIPSNDADFDTLVRVAGLKPGDVKNVHVGFNLMPAILSHRVDAILGFANDEAVRLGLQTHSKPTVLTVDKLGVPTYAELVFVANSKRLASDSGYAATVGKFVRAYLSAARAAQRDRATAVSIMGKVTKYQRGFVEIAVPQTLDAFNPPAGALGCLSPRGWQRYVSWMVRTKLLSKPVPISQVVSTKYVRAC